jgi:hypothetical protein
LSGPTTWREWIWIAAASAWIVFALRLPSALAEPAGLAEQTIRAAGLFFTGAFVVASLAEIRSLFNRTAVATALSAVAVAGWYAALGLSWQDFRTALVTSTWQAYRMFDPQLPDRIPDGSAMMEPGGVAAYGAEIARSLVASADLFPGFLAIAAMAAGWLTWTWYHRIALRPIGTPPPQFRLFRFWDHAIWFLVIAAAGVLFLPAGALSLVAQNLLLVVVACYVVRGAAVVTTSLQAAPGLFVALMCAAMLLLLHFALIGFAIVGVADTWLDPRRRMPPPEGVPS